MPERAREISGLLRPVVLSLVFAAIGLPALSACDGGDGDSRGSECGEAVRASLQGPWWDSDGDGISTHVEVEPRNAHHCFDTLFVNVDPSEGVGKAYDGRLLGAVNLPDQPSPTPLYHHPGTDSLNTDDWGTLELINAIEMTARCWSDFLKSVNRSGPRIGILDLSLAEGGAFPPHVSHQAGLDVDVRYVRRDGREQPLNLATADSVHHYLEGTLELLFCFTESAEIEYIFVDTALVYRFVDWTGGQIVGLRGHHHHFHVRIVPAATMNGSPGTASRTGTVWMASVTDSAAHTAPDPPSPAARDERLALTTVRQIAGSLAHAAQTTRIIQQDTGSVPRFLARVGPSQSISILNISRGQEMQERVVYSPQRKRLSNVRIDPSERYVSFIETTVVSPSNVQGRSDLVVVGPTGSVVHRDTGSVQRYTWLGRAQKVAQIQGTPEEGGVGFKPTGTYIVDLNTKRKVELRTPAPAYKVEWAAFDSALYIETLHPVDGSRVFRYDLQTGRLNATRHHDIYFSPAGTFYLHYPGEHDPAYRVYDARSNRAVEISDTLGVPQRWVYDEDNYLLLAKVGRRSTGQTTPSGIQLTMPFVEEHLVYDVARGQVVSRTKGTIPDIITPRGELPVIEQGQLRLLREGVRRPDVRLRRQ